MAKEVKYTPKQEKVINFRGNNLLVSAAAGSGKTTVMIQRVCDLIIKDSVPINKFLIISFTKASASDMKNKLIKKLSSLEPTPFILEQLDDILTSDVSNLHSFCARLLKAYFYEVGLDPTFVVLDETEVEVCKEKALLKLFNEKSEAGDKDFFELIDIFSRSRKDTGLKTAILKLYDFLCSIVDKETWFKEKVEGLYNSNLEKNTGAKIINAHLKAEKIRCEKLIADMITECAQVGEEKLVAYLQALDSVFKLIRLDSEFFDNAKRLGLKQRLPNIPKPTEGKEFLQEKVKILKEDLTKRFDKLKEYACFDSLEDIVSNLEITKKRLYSLYNLTKEFEEKFKAYKKEKGGLDFNDLEQYTLKVLNNPTILEEIRSKYDYVFVDEYQDINGVQEAILTQISKIDNRFMVGDVKQSIYRFRLCDPEIFLEKYNSYQSQKNKGELILLNANFRSKSGILDFVNAIFDSIMTVDFGGVDYKKEARLNVGSDSQVDEDKRVELLFADTSSLEVKEEKELEIYSVKDDNVLNINIEKQGHAEGLLIAEKISDLVAHGKIKDPETGKLRKIKYSDITILTASRNSFLNKITQTLEINGIPVSTDIEGDCLDDEYVYGVRSFIETVACYKADYSLFSCLYSKVFEFSVDELAQIKLAGGGANYFYQDVISAVNSGKLNSDLQHKLEDFFKILSSAREKASFMSVKEIAKEIISAQNLKIKISFESDYQKRLQKLNRFLSSLGDENIFEYINDTALASVKCEPAYSGSSVKVMTIHKSKGLEFGVVFLVGVNKKFNFQTLKNDFIICKDLGISLDFYNRIDRYKESTLAREAIRLVETRKMLEEEQRLLYVALTRATDYLYLVGSGRFDEIKKEMPVSPVRFMDFFGDFYLNPQDHNEAKFDVCVVDAKNLIDSDEKPTARQVMITDYDKEVISQINQVLNKTYSYGKGHEIALKTAVTELAEKNIEETNYNVLFTETDTSSLENGTLQHKVMEYLSLNETKDEIQEKVLEMANLGIITFEEAKNVMVEGISNLLENKEFKELLNNANKIMKEREFYMQLPASYLNKDAFIEDKVVVQGIVDLCLNSDNGLVIIDYKTGNLANKDSLEKYANQINLYAKAMEKSYNKPVRKKYIASLKNGMLIEVK